MKTHFLKICALLAKLALVLGLLFFLSKKGFLSLAATTNAFTQGRYFIPAAIALFTTTFFIILRWSWLVRAQGIQLSFFKALELSFIGFFFNLALPGGISGDVVKAFYVARLAPGRRASGLGSILFDRVIGLSALAMLSGAAILLGFGRFEHNNAFFVLQASILLAAVAFVAFYSYLFLVGDKRDLLLSTLKALEQQFPRAGSLTRIYESIRFYRTQRKVVFRALLLSIVVHLIYGWACLQFTFALGDFHLALLDVYLVVPLALLVTAIPILPGGVGTGHAAFSFLFLLLGSQRGADVFNLTFILGLVQAALGGFFYLKHREIRRS